MNTRKRLRIQRTSMIYMYWTREVWYVNFSLGASSANLWSACSCKSVMWKVSGLPHWAAWCAICLQLREERPIVPVRDRHASPLPARLAVSRWRHRSLVARSLVSALGWPRVMRRLWRTRLRAPRPDDTRCALHSTYCGVELTSAAELTSALYCLLKRLVWCTVECTVHVCDYEYSNLTRIRTLSLRIRVYVVTLECRALLSLLLHLFTSVPWARALWDGLPVGDRNRWEGLRRALSRPASSCTCTLKLFDEGLCSVALLLVHIVLAPLIWYFAFHLLEIALTTLSSALQHKWPVICALCPFLLLAAVARCAIHVYSASQATLSLMSTTHRFHHVNIVFTDLSYLVRRSKGPQSHSLTRSLHTSLSLSLSLTHTHTQSADLTALQMFYLCEVHMNQCSAERFSLS